MLENLKNCSKTVGLKQTLKAVENGSAKLVFMAKDADAKVTASVKELCLKKSIEIIYVDSMKQLGKACGIDVGASTVALLELPKG